MENNRMTICMDIGNSRAKCACFDEKGTIVRRDIFPTDGEGRSLLAEGVANFCGGETRVAASCVVKDILPLFDKGGAFEDAFLVTEVVKLPFRINYEKKMLGTDRIAAAAGAMFLVPGADIVVVDAGTALTFGVVLSDGVFDGGLITAGPSTAIGALAKEAPALGSVPFGAADGLVAHNTPDALGNGFYHGYCALVEGVFARIKKHYGRRFSLVLTGGGSTVISQGISMPHLREDDLVLKGIFALYGMNRA